MRYISLFIGIIAFYLVIDMYSQLITLNGVHMFALLAQYANLEWIGPHKIFLHKYI